MNTFKKFNINNTIVENLNKIGIKEPTEIQNLVIPEVLKGKDVLVKSATGSGKTLSFLIPIINSINPNSKNISSLILVPTRELAIQIESVAKNISKDMNLNILSIYGGKDVKSQINKLKKNISLIIATPGRLIDHLQKNNINLKNIDTLVIDEVDQMIHIGFKNEIKIITRYLNKDKRTLCFSATLNSEVKKLAYKEMKNPIEINGEDDNNVLENIKQKIVITTDRWKLNALLNELDNVNPFLAIIFCRTKVRCDKLENEMKNRKYSVEKIHSDIKQNIRQRIIKNFRDAKFQYLIATDVASRGLDVEGITHIFNYDIPENPELYVHRIGRTARMGKDGVAITFISEKDEEKLKDIEKFLNKTFYKVKFEK